MTLRVIKAVQELDEAKKEVVQDLRNILDEALQGNVTGFVMVKVDADGDYLPEISGEYDTDVMLGRLFRMQVLIEQADAEVDEDAEEV